MQKIFLVLIGYLTLVGCSSNKDELKKEKLPVPVIAVKPIVKDISSYVESIGTLHPSVNMEIYSQVNGILKEVYVAEGQWVKKDTPLMRIDQRIYEIRLREVEAQVRMDKVESEAAQRKIERYRELARRDLVAQAEWDDIVTHADKAQAILYLSQARLNAAELDKENCVLKSPIDGRIGKLDVHPGFLVSGTGSLLCTISQMDPLLVEFTVTEQELTKIPKELPSVDIHAICGSSFGAPCAKGTITFIDNHFDTKTGQIVIRAKTENPEFNFRPGQIVKLRIPISTSSNIMLIPQKAVRYHEQGTYVYLVNEEKKVAVRQIVLGEEHGPDVVVKEGISTTDLIITDGHLRATPGSKVDVQI